MPRRKEQVIKVEDRPTKIETTAKGVEWQRMKGTIDRTSAPIPQAFYAQGPFSLRSQKYHLGHRVIRLNAPPKQANVEGEKIWFGVIGRKKQQWFAILRGLPNASTLDVTFSWKDPEFDFDAFLNQTKQLPKEEQKTTFAQFVLEKI